MGFSEMTAHLKMCSRISAGKSNRRDWGGLVEKTFMVSDSTDFAAHSVSMCGCKPMIMNLTVSPRANMVGSRAHRGPEGSMRRAKRQAGGGTLSSQDPDVAALHQPVLGLECQLIRIVCYILSCKVFPSSYAAVSATDEKFLLADEYVV